MGFVGKYIGVGEVLDTDQRHSQTTDKQDNLLVWKQAFDGQAWFGLSTMQLSVSWKGEVLNSSHNQIRER